MAELSSRRFHWFAHVTKQRRVRSAEIMPAEGRNSDRWHYKYARFGMELILGHLTKLRVIASFVCNSRGVYKKQDPDHCPPQR